MAAGTITGSIFVWNLIKNESIKISVPHKSAVLALKFVKSQHYLLMSTSMEGSVYLTEFSRNLMGISLSNVEFMKDRVVFSINSLLADPDKSLPSDDFSIIALGAVGSIIVMGLKPKPRILWEFKKKSATKRTTPYIDWGRGALPGKAENLNAIMAIGWNKVVQLVEVEDPHKGIGGFIFNGYYESDYEILTLKWIAEDVLLIFTSIKQFHLLYSGNFTPGRYKEKVREEALESALLKKLNKRIDSPELEQPFKVPDTFVMQVYNFERDNVMKNTYQHTFLTRDDCVIGLTKSKLLKGKLLTWEKYLMRIKNTPWVGILWIALEIYLGSIKGFANLPQYKGIREQKVRDFMEGYISKELKQYLEKNRPVGDPGGNLVVLQATVELCVKIGAYNLMFTELLNVFMEYGLENEYLATLEPYIFANAFKSILISRELVYKQINFYAKQGRITTLEKVLLFLNLKGQDLDHLVSVCIVNKMFSALIYVSTLEGDYTKYITPAECMIDELKRSDFLKTSTPGERLTEKSRKYLVYKLLWYIQLCFKGEKYPRWTEREDALIPTEIWPDVIYSLLEWLLKEPVENIELDAEVKSKSNLKVIMELDAKVLFQVLGLLFHIQNLKELITEVEKYKKVTKCVPIHFTELLKRFAMISQEIDSTRTHSQYYFNLFLTQISTHPETKMETDLCISTAKSLISYEYHPDEFNEYEHEQLIQDMLKNCVSLNGNQIEGLIKEASKSPYTELLVFLEETKGDYSRCFEIYLMHSKRLRAMMLFPWLEHMKTTIKGDIEIFHRRIYESIEKMVIVNKNK